MRLTALADASAIVGSHATRARDDRRQCDERVAGDGDRRPAAVLRRDGHASLPGGRAVRSRIDELLAGPGATTAAARRAAGGHRGPSAGSRHGQLLRPAGVPPPDGDRRGRRHRGRALERDAWRDARVAITALAPTIRRVPEAESGAVGSDGGADAVAARRSGRRRRSDPDLRRACVGRVPRAMAAVIGRRAIEGAVARAEEDRSHSRQPRAARRASAMKVDATLNVNGTRTRSRSSRTRACCAPSASTSASPAPRRAATTPSAAPA